MNSDLGALKERLTKFADNGQLSIFSGNWFDADGRHRAYKLPPELDLICTAHYLEALKMQAKASEVAALLGGKMPHVMTVIPGGTSFVPTEQKLDDLKYLVDEIYDWVESTMIPDTLAIAPDLQGRAGVGQGLRPLHRLGRVREPEHGDERPLPARRRAGRRPERSPTWRKARSPSTWAIRGTRARRRYTSPYFVTEPEFTSYDVNDRYSWIKCPAYDGKPYEAGGLSRILVAYKRNVPFVVEQVNGLLEALGAPGNVAAAQSTLGRTAVRQIESLYIAGLMKEWVGELVEAVKGGDSEYFRKPATITGSGTGFWEAPRGALYHSEKVVDGKIDRLPDHHSHHVERRPAQCQRGERTHGAGLDRRAGGRHREAHQRPAHRAQLRPVHRLRRACDRAGDGQELRDRHEPLGGEVTWHISHITAKRIPCRSSSRTGSTWWP